MAKDPAVLWYWSDWFSGTSLLSRHLKGCYMDLLHAQFSHGRLSLEEIKICLGADFGSAWPALQKKFKQDENGLFFNERMEIEKSKRQAYNDSRKANFSKKPPKNSHMDIHMDNHMEHHMASHMENRNRNENTDEVNELGGAGGKRKFVPPSLDEFRAYWVQSGYSPEVAVRAWTGYHEAEWKDSRGSPIRNWKQKCQHVWFKPEHKINGTHFKTPDNQSKLGTSAARVEALKNW